MAATTAKKTAATPKKVVVRKPRSQTPPTVGVVDDLHAYIPDPEVAKRYVGREVNGVWDIVLAKSAMQNAENILLDGDTGAGKTLFGEAAASLWQCNYYSVPCDVSVDPSALYGRQNPTEVQGVYKWQDGPVTQLFRHGGILNLSEVNFMMPKIAASLYPALDGRRYLPLLGHEGEIVRAHLGTEGTRPCWCSLPAAECNKRRVLIIADMNGKYRGTLELNAAFKNRWAHIVPWGYNSEVEEKLIGSPTIRDIAASLRVMDTEIRTPVSTNMLMEMERFIMRPELGIDYSFKAFASSFDVDEQNAVLRVLDLNKSKIEKDIAFLVKQKTRTSASRKPGKDDDDVEEIEFDFEED